MTEETSPPAPEPVKPKPERSYWLEGILELGRNWALAVVMASAGWAAFRAELVDGPEQWNKWVFNVAIFAALIWMLLAVLRFDEGLAAKLTSTLGRVMGWLLSTTLFGLGVSIVMVVGKFSDNAAIVKVCESVPANVPSRIHSYNECKRLKAQRDALRARFEGEANKDHAPAPPADKAR